MGAVAAVVIRKEREIVDIFRGASATSPETARDPAELGIHHRLAFDRLIRRAVLREAVDGRYYLDEPSWRAVRGMRRRMVLVIILIAVIVLGGVIASQAVGAGAGAPGVQ
jgi:hypothetical protein